MNGHNMGDIVKGLSWIQQKAKQRYDIYKIINDNCQSENKL